MNSQDMRRLLSEVALAGQCSRPIRLRGETVNVVTGEIELTSFKVACKDRREAVCPACSRRYGTDAWIIAATGLNGGKGVDEAVIDRPKAFVTVTAPSFGAVHTVASDGRCVQGVGIARCPHGLSMQCAVHHGADDPALGQSLCANCFDYRGAVLWNANASKLWALTIQQARRNLAARAGIKREDLQQLARLHYFKVAEMQRRGLVHFHALVRLDEVEWEFGLEGLGESALVGALRSAIGTIRLENSYGNFGWGRIVDIQILGRLTQDARMVASYLAKYVTKTSGDALELARRFDSQRDISYRVKNPHLQRMANNSWEMGGDQDFERLRLKEHAHTLGFSGQLITKSRSFSTTFGALRQARADFNAPLRTGEPVVGSFWFEGRGYDDPKASTLANALTQLEAGLRNERVAREASARTSSKGDVGHE